MGWSFFKRDNRQQRETWEANLVWFRLRYVDGTLVTRGLQLLSRHNICGRIALYYHHDSTLPTLHVAVANEFAGLLKQIAADFNFEVTLFSAENNVTSIQPLISSSQLPTQQTFAAHIINEQLFITVEAQQGDFLPFPDSAETKPRWLLPNNPPLGISTVPNWGAYPIPEQMVAEEPVSGRWTIGRNQQGDLIQSEKQVNLYGQRQAIAYWLTQLVLHTISTDPANLIVIDGTGDLVPQLKRKTQITDRLGDTVRYIDINNSSAVLGFNPLAPLPEESDIAQIARWQKWLHRMGVSSECKALLQQAHTDGVDELNQLQKWLHQQARQQTSTAIHQLQGILGRFMKTRPLDNWLAWPTNPYDRLPHGALLFSCKAETWAAQHLLDSVLLAALAMPAARLICHGLPWQQAPIPALAAHPQLIVSNAPCLQNGSLLITQTHSTGLHQLSQRFHFQDILLLENLDLMSQGEAVLLHKNVVTGVWKPTLTHWKISNNEIAP
ncbi:MAG: hypothetical protein ACPG8W_03200 [Candidatus Promineifilaceae bacterium]